MDYPAKIDFNPQIPKIMHIDLNSCFATVEQQANPQLRGKPIAVAAYKSKGGCILAASIEAKRFGIKTGMSVGEGQHLFPNLIVLEPDPWKYRSVHMSFRQLLKRYTDNFAPKSIDEFVLDMTGFSTDKQDMVTAAKRIKSEIKSEIGEWLTVSVGIAPNRYLAKIASNIKKPDGLEVIDQSNHLEVFNKMELDDLTGIKRGNVARLSTQKIFSVADFYNASPMRLQQAFHAVTGHYWYMRLRGYEVDDSPTKRRSYSNSTALGKKFTTPTALAPVLSNLVEKMSARMRSAGYSARGVHLAVSYKKTAPNQSYQYWNKGVTIGKYLFSPVDIYKVAYTLLLQAPWTGQPVHIIAVSCFDLGLEEHIQLDLLDEVKRKKSITHAQDLINKKWGNFVINPAKMLQQKQLVKDRIAFGGVKELEEIIL